MPNYNLGNLVISLIKIYQKTISFDHGIFKFFYPYGFCRFWPSCSNYAIAAIKKYGLARGGLKSLWRLIRCHPFNAGGTDQLK